jgi:hypothetical protein
VLCCVVLLLVSLVDMMKPTHMHTKQNDFCSHKDKRITKYLILVGCGYIELIWCWCNRCIALTLTLYTRTLCVTVPQRHLVLHFDIMQAHKQNKNISYELVADLKNWFIWCRDIIIAYKNIVCPVNGTPMPSISCGCIEKCK